MTIQEALQILELSAPISKAALKKAYRDALMVWHPDRFVENTQLKTKAEEKTCQINEAYSQLSRLPENGYPYQVADSAQQAAQPPRPQPQRQPPPVPRSKPQKNPQPAAEHGFPQPKPPATFSVIPASFFLRAWAFIIDYIVYGIAGAIVIFSFEAFSPSDQEGFKPLIVIFCAWLYHAFLESSEKQATLGKLACGILVIDSQGNRVSFGRASARFFGMIISWFVPFGFVMCAWTEKRQCLHDMMAGCLVLKKERQANATSATRSTFRKSPDVLTVASWGVAVVAGMFLIALIAHVQSPKKSAGQDYALNVEPEKQVVTNIIESLDAAPTKNPFNQETETSSLKTESAEFAKLQSASYDAAVKRFGGALNNPDSEFTKLCDAEYESASKNNDPIFSKADWPEKLAERVADNLYLRADDKNDLPTLKALCEIGHKKSLWNLALAYLSGVGTTKDEAEGMKWCRKAAEEGVAEAQKFLAVFLFTKEKNMAESAKWFHKAADQGDLDAQLSFGKAYLNGYGVQKNEAEGLRLIRAAAEKGYDEAQYELGMHLSARLSGVESEYQEGVKWLRRAAEQGHHTSQVVMGAIYSDPEIGNLKDYVEAHMWYSLATKNQNGNQMLAERIAQLEKAMTPEQITEAHRRTDEFKHQRIGGVTPPENPGASKTAVMPSVKPDEQLKHLPTDYRLISGSVLTDRLHEFGGKGKLLLDNGLTEDAYVKLISGDELWASFYVRGGEKFTFDHVPDAKYHLLYCTGFGWNADRRDFARGRHAVRYDEVLDYSTTRRTEGTTIVTSTGVITLTLHKVANGNTKTTDIPLEEFDRY